MMRGFCPHPLVSLSLSPSEEDINLLPLAGVLGFDQMASIGGNGPRIELDPVPEF